MTEYIDFDERTTIDDNFSNLERLRRKINEDIRSGKKITINQLYRDYLGIPLSFEEEQNLSSYRNEYGWDLQGFRRLYKHIVLTEEL